MVVDQRRFLNSGTRLLTFRLQVRVIIMKIVGGVIILRIRELFGIGQLLFCARLLIGRGR